MSSAQGGSPTEVIYRQNRPLLLLRSATLRVTSGVDLGQAIAVSLHRVRVGKASDNDLVLSDPKVSRHHLELRVEDHGLVVRDLDTTNGTYFKGARIQAVVLEPGAELRLGQTVVRLEPGEEVAAEVGASPTFGELVGASPAMQQLYGLLATLAPSDVTVLIEGETGTGKELVAEELHRRSPRRQHVFCVVDCGAMPASLIESELFGHVRGAFTGAITDREGTFERADGGTIFLDEIGELPLELQTRLLRVLEGRQIRRIGDSRQRPVDVRVVAATNCDLEQQMRRGGFRKDLFYRLAVVRIVLPPLRERVEDIPALARHFLWRTGCADADQILTPEVIRVLKSRQWPGNVRELRNAVERAVLFADSGSASAVRGEPHLPQGNASAGSDVLCGIAQGLPPALFDQPYKVAKERLNREFEEEYLLRMCRQHGRNISKMAEQAGIDRRMVRKLLDKHGVTPLRGED
jgi:transcriptional regulator with GAF, ATPase, and Fis domain